MSGFRECLSDGFNHTDTFVTYKGLSTIEPSFFKVSKELKTDSFILTVASGRTYDFSEAFVIDFSDLSSL